MKCVWPCLVFAASFAVAGSAQEAKEAAKPAVDASKGPRTPVDVHFLVTRYQGEKKVGSKPYTLRVISEEQGAFFLGTQVPYRTSSPQVGAMAAFKMIGATARCLVRHAADGRFRVELEFDDSPG